MRVSPPAVMAAGMVAAAAVFDMVAHHRGWSFLSTWYRDTSRLPVAGPMLVGATAGLVWHLLVEPRT